MGAGPRRALVYVLAAALVVVAGLFAVRLARPPDPYGEVRVQQVSIEDGAQTERAQWDSEQGRGVMDVRESDGVVRRYYMESDGGDGMRVWGGEEVSPEEE
jgi:hypothetical protein